MRRPQNRIESAWRRGIQYKRTLGWWRFATRLLKVWVWLPRLVHAPWRPVQRSSPRTRPFGVNVLGYLGAETGLGEVARQAIQVLDAVGVPYVANSAEQNELANREAAGAEITGTNPYAFNWVCVNTAEADFVAWKKGRDYFAGRYNIGDWVWEMTHLPDEWLANFAYYDEIWVPSRFVHDTVAPVCPVPVRTIPYAVARKRTQAPKTRTEIGLPPDSFVFLFLFHYYSLYERKNPLGLIRAFRQAFSGQKDVVLVIKSAGGEHTAGAAALRQAARNFPGVIVMDQVIPGDAITRLYDLCDCYVSLHRAEGFGLTIAEAMAAGKPVIATAYGGNLDFMTFDNSYPVDARIVELQTDHGPYKKGWTWADPDLDKASELMRRVYENRDEAAAKGERAADDIRRRLSAKAVGQLVKSRLEEIAADKGINL